MDLLVGCAVKGIVWSSRFAGEPLIVLEPDSNIGSALPFG